MIDKEIAEAIEKIANIRKRYALDEKESMMLVGIMKYLQENITDFYRAKLIISAISEMFDLTKELGEEIRDKVEKITRHEVN